MSALRKMAGVAAAGFVLCGLVRAGECLEVQASTGSGPPGCSYAGMAYDSARGRTVWVGGLGQTPGFQVWEWNGASWADKTVGAPSEFGRVPGFVYDSARGVFVLFGWTGATWEYNGSTWVNRNLAGPSQRAQTYMAYDAGRGQTVVFGGGSGQTPLSDTWTYDGTSWTQRFPSNSPSARTAGTMTYDSARGVVVLHGGFVGSTQASSDETWEWNGETWTLVSTEGPSRFGHRTVYNAQAGMTMIIDGYSGSTPQPIDRDVWGWDGSMWRYLGTNNDPLYAPAIYSASAYDAGKGEVLLRQPMHPLPTSTVTFVVKTSIPGVQSQPQSVTVEEGCMAALGVTASSTMPLTYQWRKSGIPIPGALTATLITHSATFEESGIYDCVITSVCGQTVTQPAFLTVLARCPGDPNRDGVRNFLDLNEVLSGFGQACPVPR